MIRSGFPSFVHCMSVFNFLFKIMNFLLIYEHKKNTCIASFSQVREATLKSHFCTSHYMFTLSIPWIIWFFFSYSIKKTILKKSQHAHIARISHKASYNNPTITSSTTISQWHGNLEKEMKHSRYSCTFTIVLYDDDDAGEWRLYV